MASIISNFNVPGLTVGNTIIDSTGLISTPGISLTGNTVLGPTSLVSKSYVDAITPAFTSITGKPTTLSGYGITDAATLNQTMYIGSTAVAINRASAGITLTGTAIDGNAGTATAALGLQTASTVVAVASATAPAAGQVLTAISSTGASWQTLPPGGVTSFDTRTGAITLLSSDVTTALTYTPVNRAGDTLVGYLILNASPTVSLGAATKSYVDAAISGLAWLNPLIDPNLVDDSLNTPPVSPVTGTTYIAGAAPTGAWLNLAGHAFDWSGTAWLDLLSRAVTTGDRFGVCLEKGSSPAGGLTGKINNIAQVSGGTAGAFTYTFTAPAVPQATFVSNSISLHFGHSYTYTGTAWVEFSGPAATPAGTGLYYNGNMLNVALGAGITALPSSEVGVDVYATGGLMNTVDGVISSTLTNAQLSLTLVGTAGTYKSVTADAYGRITSGTNPTTLSGFGITDAVALVQLSNNTQSVTFPTVTTANAQVTGGAINGTIIGNVTPAAGTFTLLTTTKLNGNYPAVLTGTTNSFIMPAGSTVNRDVTPLAGYTRFNSTLNKPETYNGSVWLGMGGATGAGGDDVFYENGVTVTTSYTLTTGKNASSVGPVTINTGITVTVPTGQRWVIQ